MKKTDAHSWLATAIQIIFLIAVFVFKIRFWDNIFITIVVGAVACWFIASIIISFPPIYKKLEK